MSARPPVDAQKLRRDLASAAPQLWNELCLLVAEWVEPVIQRLEQGRIPPFPKTFNDPIWGVIELYPHEVLLLDSPLLQRLRGVRQLGMAHYVYPGAVHDRLEHSRGAVEAAERMLQALARNASHHRRYGVRCDPEIPAPSALDRVATRLGALLHDTGHGPFSHATEELLVERLSTEVEGAKTVLRAIFEGVAHIAPSELLAALMVLGEPLRRVFEHPKYNSYSSASPADLAPAIAARILGSRSCLLAPYLSGVVSGPLDADKLDYMARDSHHAGLPISLDINRLISKLEVVTITPDNALNPALRERAKADPRGRFYELGISLSGVSSYEQMIVARVILYDRLYFHHKVRAAEGMVRQLFRLAQPSGHQLTLKDFFYSASDDTMVAILGGSLRTSAVAISNEAKTAPLSTAILQRKLYHRAFAFAGRFIDAEGLPEKDRQDERTIRWNAVLTGLKDSEKRTQFASGIYDKAKLLGNYIPELKKVSDNLLLEHILVDVAPNKATATGSNDLLTTTEDGYVGTPNLFFNPEKWTQAYENQKQAGFVFAPYDSVALVALASKMVFFEKFKLIMQPAADHAAKAAGLIPPHWIEQAHENHACTSDFYYSVSQGRQSFGDIHADELILPDDWRTSAPNLGKVLAEDLKKALPSGLPAKIRKTVIAGINDLCMFVDMSIRSGLFMDPTALSPKTPEAKLQRELLKHLASRGVSAKEGAEFAGGESDVILSESLLIENKVETGNTRKPLDILKNTPWQARRYAMALYRNVFFVIIGYKPADDAAIHTPTQSIKVIPNTDGRESFAEIRLVVPYDYSPPSAAKAPTAASTALAIPPAASGKSGGA